MSGRVAAGILRFLGDADPGGWVSIVHEGHDVGVLSSIELETAFTLNV